MSYREKSAQEIGEPRRVSGAIRSGKEFPPEHLTWEPMSMHLRIRWCQAQHTYFPVFLGVTAMVAISHMTSHGGWHLSGDWIEVAKEFHAAGFTPEEFVLLNRAVRVDDRATPANGYDPRPEYVPNSLITLSSGHGGYLSIRLRATDWVGWLERVRAGGDPNTITAAILAPHWGESTEIIHR